MCLAKLVGLPNNNTKAVSGKSRQIGACNAGSNKDGMPLLLALRVSLIPGNEVSSM